MDPSINSYTTTDILINERIFKAPFQDFRTTTTASAGFNYFNGKWLEASAAATFCEK